jgi:alpha-beta hydrolase superfamily lysophospholipase
MARALRDSGMAVYAVELPGHDVGATRESFAPLADVVDRVVAEINRRSLTAMLLWGHSSGTALAVETARRLQRAGTTVPRVFLGAQLLGAAADRRATSPVPVRPRRGRPSCSTPECWLLNNRQTEREPRCRRYP